MIHLLGQQCSPLEGCIQSHVHPKSSQPRSWHAMHEGTSDTNADVLKVALSLPGKRSDRA